MRNGDAKISYETVDRTDKSAGNQGRQQAQEENQQRMRELQAAMERDREQAIREAQNRARSDDENLNERLRKREREERERKLKEQKEFLQLQDALMSYDFQKAPRIKKESFRALDVEEIGYVRLALIGPTGSGKTSFIGTLQVALGGTQSAFGQGTEKKGTINLEEYSVQESISLVDTRGFSESDEELVDECLKIMSGRIRPGEEIVRGYDQSKGEAAKSNPQMARKAQSLSKYAHGVIFVVKANDPRLKDGKYKDTLKKIREHFREDGYAPVTVITYLDKLKDEEDKKSAFDMASWATGSSSERTFLIANYTHENNQRSFDIERTALDILDFALLSAERFIRITAKRKEKKEFLQLQDALMRYDFQKAPRIKKESFRDLDVEEIEYVRLALIGPTGSGKTSFIGTLQRALGGIQSAFEQGTGKEGTVNLEEYSVQENISLVDTRGFFENDEKLVDECLKIMSGRIRPGEEIGRGYDQSKGEAAESDPQMARKAQALSKYAHAVIFVVKANDPRLKDGKYKDTLKKVREHFREDGYAPVTVITYLDRLKDEKDKNNAFDMASWATGTSSERTFFIANYTHENNQKSFAMERTALDILDFALLSAERFIRITKQREKNQMEREIAAGGASGGVETLAHFFTRLKKKYNWTDQGKMKDVLSDLLSNEINTVRALKELWGEVKGSLPLSIGMKRCLEEEIKNI